MKNLLITIILFIPCIVVAQNRTARVSTDGQFSHEAVMLARLCVNEASFHNPREIHDCGAIYQVIKYRAEHVYSLPRNLGRPVSFAESARIYSPTVFGRRPRRGGRPWVPFLRGDGARPRHWPRVLAWETQYASMWNVLLTYAQKLFDGEVNPPCAQTPRHWGNRSDIRLNGWTARISRGEWGIANCGVTRNFFLYPIDNQGNI